MTGPRPLAGVLQDPDSFEGGSSHFANYDNVLGNDYLQVLRRGDTIYFDGKPGTPASVDLLSGLLPLDKDALPHAQHQVDDVLYYRFIGIFRAIRKLMGG